MAYEYFSLVHGLFILTMSLLNQSFILMNSYWVGFSLWLMVFSVLLKKYLPTSMKTSIVLIFAFGSVMIWNEFLYMVWCQDWDAFSSHFMQLFYHNLLKNDFLSWVAWHIRENNCSCRSIPKLLFFYFMDLFYYPCTSTSLARLW